MFADSGSRFVAFSCALLLTGVNIGLSQSTPRSVQTPPSAEQLRKQVAEATGDERLKLQVDLVGRRELPLDERRGLISEIIGQYEASPDVEHQRAVSAAFMAECAACMQEGKLTEGLAAAKRSAAAGEKCFSKYPQYQISGLANQSLLAYATGNIDDALTFINQAFAVAAPVEDQVSLVDVHRMMAVLAEPSGAIDLCVKHLALSFEAALEEESPDKAGMAAETLIGFLHERQQDEIARQWVERIAPLEAQIVDPRVRYMLAIRRAGVKRRLGEPAAAIQLLQSLEADNTNVDVQIQAFRLMELSHALRDSKQYDEAIEAAQASLTLLASYPRSELSAQTTLIEALLAAGRNEEALEKIEEIADDSEPYLAGKEDLLEVKSRAHYQLGNFEQAADALFERDKIRQENTLQRATEQAAFMTKVFEDRQQEAEMRLLTEQRVAAEQAAELSELRAEQQTRNAKDADRMRNLTILFAVAGLAIGVALFRLVSARKAAIMRSEHAHSLNETLETRLKEKEILLREEIDTRRNLEVELERKRRHETMGVLTSGVAHDFNNLLSVVLQANELIEMSEPALSETSRDVLVSSTRAAESGASIVAQLLAYARQQPLSPVDIRVSDWAKSVAGLLRKSVGDEVQFVQHDNTKDASISVDSAQLTTAVINLLQNSNDAVQERGSVTFSLDCITLDDPNSTSSRDLEPGSYVSFKIVDNGCGMTEDEISKAAEPFYTTKGPHSGTGLGLSTAMGFIKQSGGDFRITSQPGLGTTVEFLLPVVAPSIGHGSVAGNVLSRASGESVLVVDDHDEVRAVTAAKLRSLGYQVATAASADEALKVLESSPASIVLSDVRMPGSMDGRGLRSWLKVHQPHVTVILMTGYTNEALDSETHCIRKPFSHHELLSALNSRARQK